MLLCSSPLHIRQDPSLKNNELQAGAELCQAQVKLEVIVYVVEEGWS